MTASYSKWMDWKPTDSCSQRTYKTNKSPFVGSVGSVNKDSEPVCIFCRHPVERGTVGTGALAGDDLHMDCYRKRYPQGHPLKEEER